MSRLLQNPDENDDGFRSYNLARAIQRERMVRMHVPGYEPRNADEQRQWDEGPVENAALDAVRHG
jgi:hypothetical protein